MKMNKSQYNNNKFSQAVIVEFLFIAIIIGIVFGTYSLINANNVEQIYSNNDAQNSAGMTTLFLQSNSTLNVQELIRNNTLLNESGWNNVTTFINQRYDANIYVLNNDLSINTSLRNCPISRFNNQLLKVPIFIYDNTTYSIEKTKYFQIKLCRGN